MDRTRGTTCRSSVWLRAAIASGAVLFSICAYMLFTSEGRLLECIVLTALAVFCYAGLIDATRAKIRVADSTLMLRHNFNTTVYERSSIDTNTYDNGWLFLRCRDEQNIKLPDIGDNAQAVYNTVRAWHKSGKL